MALYVMNSKSHCYLLDIAFLLVVYLLTRPKKDTSTTDEEVPNKTSSAPVPTTASTTAPAIETAPIIPPEPIPEDQQRELFKWILEEKRKVKTKDREEKKHIEEEKAILKQFIRAKTIPEIK